MTPVKDIIEVTRGATLGREWIAQKKVWEYDPAVNNTVADLKRTHLENLEFYGFNYQYIDFATDYASAELLVFKPYRNTGDKNKARTPILKLTDTAGELILGPRSVKLVMTDEATEDLDFDNGIFKLRLITGGGDVDMLTFGEWINKGDK